MPIPTSGRILAIDWGANRIGLAISDETQLVASPLGVLKRRTGRRLPIGDFLTLVEREHPVGLVVGIPVGDDGLEGAAGTAAREMGRVFAARSGLPVDWIDESFTTVDAMRHSRETGQRAGSMDELAAAEILQRWLDARR
ncbi:MAG: Holliday junction resolvase RuvX [Gemmatimonadales bacterium]